MDKLAYGADLMYCQNQDNSEMRPMGLNVFIWDMDETLILLKSLLDGTFAESFRGVKDLKSGKAIGKQWEGYILHVCDELFFYEQIENYNQPFLEYLKEYDDGRDLTGYDFSKDGLSSPRDDPNKRKLAYRHRFIAEKYSQAKDICMWETCLKPMKKSEEVANSKAMNAIFYALEPKDLVEVSRSSSAFEVWRKLEDIHGGANGKKKGKDAICLIANNKVKIEGLRKFYDEGHIKLWDELYNRTDGYTDGWLSSARVLLEQLSGKNESFESHAVCSKKPAGCSGTNHRNINALVTSGSLIPSLVKCLLFRLDGVISKENVFSSWDVGKLQCFKWIKENYDGPRVRFCVIGDGLEECFAAEKMGWPFIKIDLQPYSRNRFPGLSTKMLGCYMDVVYGASRDKCHEDDGP